MQADSYEYHVGLGNQQKNWHPEPRTQVSIAIAISLQVNFFNF